ncbi:golgin subfamily A member 1-like isoform X4 [Haliotis rubra]|uniref:golgin subfamily A member 1-like isoform X4 n=1 Tax=Haliotis rubra TaxID=36100 RepID=UPI001EE5B1FA|nr:golgin subfamily A member 1-like isoform X4 [Haliotis rubra]
MFAKLKKRIKDESGSVVDGDKTFLPPPFPGHASPIRRSSSTVTLTQGLSKDPFMSGDSGMSGAASPASQSSEDSQIPDSSREEVVMMLLKRTEQCKKMESKISEYAALIKEKNKAIDRLETEAEKQQEVTNEKLDEQSEELKAKFAEFVEAHKKELAEKDEEMTEKINALNKRNTELAANLKQEEDYKHRLFQREEEQDEVQGLTTQELAKVKHMLLITQEDLSQCRAELTSTTDKHHEAEKSLKEAQNQLTNLKTKMDELEKENTRLTEVNEQHMNVVAVMTKEKAVFEKRLDEVNSQLTAKVNQLSKLTAEYSELENEHKALQRSSEVHKNKTSKLISEKDDNIEQLSERIKMLEQRSHDHTLSGDERVKAIEVERDSLEHKLTESRQQLTEIKSTWSDKITHLEEQISHLNLKIVEDNEEMANLRHDCENMQENFHKQIQELQHSVEDAEKRAFESWELASQKDRQYEKQKHELEVELQKARLSAVDSESGLRAKITALETQLMEIETARDHMKNEADQRIAQLEAREQEVLEEHIKLDKQLKTLEVEHNRIQTEYTDKMEESSRLKTSMEEKRQSETSLVEKISGLEVEVQSVTETLENLKKNLKSGQAELKESNKEKDELLVRNAELSQQLESRRQQAAEKELLLVAEVREKGETITSLQQTISQLEEKITLYDKRCTDYEIKKSEDQVTTATVGELQTEITELQNQLTDKNRALKKQEQTLKDLRITLQRELKVQALPNDDSSELVDSHSPQPNRKFDSNKRFQADLLLAGLGSGSRGHSHVQMAASGILNEDDAKLRSGTVGIRQELDKDVNFQYLKHVILKFMLSRGAMKLVKAIAMLLHFSRDEQELIKQTLEYKMSWFGSRPSLGKGQTSKVIPPSY